VPISYALNPAALFASMPAGIAQGLIWGILALGVYITFRILNIADLTVEGTFTTGGAVTVMLILAGWNPWSAMLIAALAGLASGAVTGILYTLLGIPSILSGILTQYALYSINLAIMGMAANKALPASTATLAITSRSIPMALVTGILTAAILIAVLYWYFGTEHGSAMRATGANPEMAKAQGINIKSMYVIGLAISNALVAFAGGLMAQFQGFADINMGRGSIVIGLAAVIIGEVLGEALLGKHLNFAGRLSFMVCGGILYYIIVVLVLWMKLNANFLKLFTAVIVGIFLAVPYLQGKRRSSFAKARRQAKKYETEA